MDERKVEKDALKKEYLKEIAHQLAVENKVLDDDIYVNDSGHIIFEVNNDTLIRIAKDLADKLANTKAEIYLQRT
ncbi:MAG: hypothetical protein ABSC91_09935 [Candidatus Bathyarchaeia archaeon]|jgi:hypothetical protein